MSIIQKAEWMGTGERERKKTREERTKVLEMPESDKEAQVCDIETHAGIGFF